MRGNITQYQHWHYSKVKAGLLSIMLILGISGFSNLEAIDRDFYSGANDNAPNPCSLVISETHTDIYCQELNGSITLSVSGGNGSLNYSWTGPLGYTSTMSSLTHLRRGDYTVVVVDSLGCSDTLSVTLVSITDSDAPILDVYDYVEIGFDTSSVHQFVESDLVISSSDACPITTTFSPSSISCDDTSGTDTIWVTARDPFGNSTSKFIVVKGVDIGAPDVQLYNRHVLQLNGNGKAFIFPSTVDSQSVDNCSDLNIILSETEFDCTDMPYVDVTVTAEDFAGNSESDTWSRVVQGREVRYVKNDQSDTYTVRVFIDDCLPPVAICKDVDLHLNASGVVTIHPDSVNDGSFDNCNLWYFTLDDSTFTCQDTGVNWVNMHAYDMTGNMSCCPVKVTVRDTIKPEVVCNDITVYLDESGQVIINGSDLDGGSSANCKIDSFTLSDTSFTCSSLGENLVELTAVDNNGLQSTCTARVTVLDTISPTAICKSVQVYLDANGNAIITASQLDNGSDDNCSSISFSVDQDEFSCTDLGQAMVTFTVTDQSNNTSSCQAMVEVIDTIAPTIVCKNITAPVAVSGISTITPEDLIDVISDNCGLYAGASVSQSSFDCTSGGTYNVTLVAWDHSGNMDSCVAQVTVVDKPIANCKDSILYLGQNGSATIMASEIDNGSFDNCGITSMTISQTNFDCSHIGENTIKFIVKDADGFSDTCEFIVTVKDSIVAVITGMPSDISVTIDSTDCGAHVTWTAPQAFDECGTVTVTSTHTSGDRFYAGSTYVVYTFNDAGGNTVVDSFRVTVNATQLIATISANNISCDGEDDGDATVTVSGGCAPYIVVWSNSETTYTIDQLTAGQYIVTVTDGSGQTVSDTVTISEPTGMTTTITSTDILCGGDVVETCLVNKYNSNNHAIWLPNLANNVSSDFWFTNQGGSFVQYPNGTARLSGEVYNKNDTNKRFDVSVWFTDKMDWAQWSALGRDYKGNRNRIGNNYQDWSYYIMDVNQSNTLTGKGDYNGQVLNLTHKPGNYKYAFQIGIAANDKDSDYGMSGWFNYTGSWSGHGDFNFDASCSEGEDCSATATIAVSGGQSPYTYSWNSGSTSSQATGLCEGMQTVVITDANGCQITDSVEINAPDELILSITGYDASCAGGTNGSAVVSITGGNAPYTYLWSNNETAASISNLAAGIYSVTVTDANGCQKIIAVTIALPACCNVTYAGGIGIDQQGCGSFDPNEITSLSFPSGGQGVIEYVWLQSHVNVPNTTGNPYWTEIANSNSPTYDPGVLTQTTYYIRCARSQGCTFYAGESNVVTIEVSPAPAIDVVQVLDNCSNELFEATEGFNVFVKGNITAKTNETEGAMALGGNLTLNGSYTLAGHTAGTFIDSGDTRNSALVVGGRVIYTSGSGINVVNNGFVKICDVTGSNIHDWDIQNNQPMNTRISAGNMNANPRINLSLHQSAASIERCPIDFNTAFARLINTANSLALCVNNISLLPADANNPSASPNRKKIQLASNTKNVLNLTWAQLDALDELTFINQPSVSQTLIINVDNASNSNISWQIPNMAGIGDSHGQFIIWNFFNSSQITLTGGGTLKGTLLAPNADIIDNNSGNIDGQLIANSFMHNGGEMHNYLFSANITGCNTACTAEVNDTIFVCAGDSVELKAEANGTYSWSHGPSTQSVTVGAGSYTVTVTGSNGCTSTKTINVVAYPAITATVSASPVSCSQNADGSASISVSSGLAPYTYLWSTNSTSSTIENVDEGSYSVVVTDANGCSTELSVEITAPSEMTLSLTSVDPTCASGTNGSVSTTVNGGTTPYTYTWSNSATSANLSNLSSGTYVVTVTDANGCSTTDSVSIARPACCNVTSAGTIANGQDNCGPFNPTAITSVSLPSGGLGGVEYIWLESNVNVPNTVGNPYWSPIAGSNSATYDPGYITQTTYYIRCSRSVGCSFYAGETNIIAMVVNPVGTATAQVISNVSCNGLSDGSASAAVSGGTSPYTYLWSNNATTPTITNLSAGTYTVVITDVNNCTSNASVTITAPVEMTLNLSSVDPTCATGTNGSVSTTITGGTTPYTYTWSNSATSANLSNLSSGTYVVTVTDANGCSATDSVSIARPACCNVTSAGTIGYGQDNCGPFNPTAITSVSLPSGGLGGVEYIWLESHVNVPNTSGNPYWSPIAGSNSATYDPGYITQTTYYIRCSRSVGCSFYAGETNIIAMVVNPVGRATAQVNNDVSCYGLSDGSATAAITGGTAPFTYLWSNNATTATVTNLSAGTYTATITDANGCSSNVSVTITEPTDLLATISGSDSICTGANDGFIHSTVSGGTTPYTYSWTKNGTQFGSTQDISGLTPGNYALVVTDANGCTYSNLVMTIYDKQLAGVTSTLSNVSCFGGSDGSIDLTINGGSTTSSNQSVWLEDFEDNQSYATSDNGNTAWTRWINSNNYYAKVMSQSSNKTFRMSNGDAKWYSEQIDISALTDVNISIDINSAQGYHENSGSAKDYVKVYYRINGGSWTYFDNNYYKAGQISGTMTATVNDLNGNYLELKVWAHSTASNEWYQIDNIEVSAEASSSSYSVLWSNSETTEDISGLSAGTYSVIVSDPNGCDFLDTFEITAPVEMTLNLTGVNPTCASGTNGSVTCSVNGGTSPYTYTWSNSATSANLSNLSSGTYVVTVTDANGCSVTDSVSIARPACCNVTSAGTIGNGQENCGPFNPAAITSVSLPSGGFGGVEYIWLESHVNVPNTSGNPYWSPIAGSNSATYDPGYITQTTYYIRCSRSVGCSFYAGETNIIAMVVNPVGTATAQVISNVSCNGLSDGSASVAVSGGTSPYSYLWSNNATTPTVSNLSAGTYTVVITDVNNCTSNASVTITAPVEMTLNLSGVNPTCASGTNGSVTCSVNGGTSPYTFIWSNSATSANLSNLSSGTYVVTVTDANGCSETDSVSIARPACCNVTSAGTIGNSQENCGPFNPAAITSVSLPSGGFGGVEYIWLESHVNVPNTSGNPYWSPIAGSNSATYDPGYITQTTYYIRCSRSVGCSFYAGETNIIAMVVNPVGTATAQVISNVSCNGLSDGSASVAVSGGTSPYSYLWSNNATTSTISNLSAGTYTVSITDANGCTSNATVTITEPTLLVASIDGTDSICAGANDGYINATVTGGKTPYTYVWSRNGSQHASSQNISTLSPGNYVLEVTDANGCTYSNLGLTIYEKDAPNVFGTSTAVSCYGADNGSIDLTLVGGSTSTNQTIWAENFEDNQTYATSDNGSTAWTRWVDSKNSYAKVKSDNSGKTFRMSNGDAKWYSEQINISSLSDVDASIEISSVQGNELESSGSNIDYVKIYYRVDNGSWTYFDNNYYKAGKITGTMTATVADLNGSTLELKVWAHSTASTEWYQIDNIEVTSTSSASNYFVLWSNNETTEDLDGLSPGSYSVIVSDAKGCSYRDTFVITQPDSISTATTVTPVSCDGSDSTVINLTDYNGARSFYLPGLAHGNEPNWTLANGKLVQYADGTAHLTGSLTNLMYASKKFDCSFWFTNESDWTSWDNQGKTWKGSSSIVGTNYENWTYYDFDANKNNVLIGSGYYAGTTLDITQKPANLEMGLQVGNAANDKDADFGISTWFFYNGNGLSGSGDINSDASVISNSLCDGAVDLSVSGGTAPYQFLWSNDDETTEDISGLCAGTYNVTVSDANGCIKIVTVVVPETSCCNVTAGGIIEDDQNNCHAFDPLKITSVSDASGGKGTLEYAWYYSTTSDTYSENSSAWTLIQGATGEDYDPGYITTTTYVVRVAKRTSCTAMDIASNVVTLEVGTGPTATIELTDAGSCGGGDGELTGSVDGNYQSFEWLFNGQTMGSSGTETVHICSDNDDAEEKKSNGDVIRGSSDLELGNDKSDLSGSDLIVGVRYQGVDVPQGAVITNAYIRFKAKSSSSTATSLSIYGHDHDDSYAIGSSDDDLSDRTPTTNQESWSPSSWSKNNYYNTPNINEVISEITSRTNWESGNDMTIMLEGTGYRKAYSHDASSSKAPELIIEWEVPADDLTIENAAFGTYSLIVTNGNGCKDTATYTLSAPTPISASGTVTNTTTTTSTSACNLDMSSLDHGKLISSNQFGTQGISISANSYGSYNDELIIFDTDESNTRDSDLEVNIGNILIFPENDVDNNNDGIYDSPDDQADGGVITLTFSALRDVKSLVFVDSENNQGRIKCYDASNNLLSTKVIGNTGDKSVQTITINTDDVKKMVVSFTTSGGIGNLKFNCPTSSSCTGEIDLSVSGGKAPYSYSWNDGSNNKDRTGLCAGTYSVTITDANGCTEIKTFTVGTTSTNSSSSSQSSDSDKLENGDDNQLGMTESMAIKSEINVWPNPANVMSNMNFTLGQSTQVEVTVCDLAGREIMQVYNGAVKAGVQNTATLNLDNVNSGVYLVVVKTQTGEALIKRLIVNK